MAEERLKNETDVHRDEAQALTRATGGEPDPDAPDTNSTTGTTPNDMYVGRDQGQDVGYAEETGAERRAEHAQAGSAEHAQAGSAEHAQAGSAEHAQAGSAEHAAEAD